MHRLRRLTSIYDDPSSEDRETLAAATGLPRDDNSTSEAGASVMDLPSETVNSDPLMENVNLLQCPINWHVGCATMLVARPEVVQRIADKLEDLAESCYFYRLYILQLVLSYECLKANNLVGALEAIAKSEVALQSMSSSNPTFYNVSSHAFQHVISASRVYVYSRMSVLENKCERELGHVVKEYNENQADPSFLMSLFGVRASVAMEYGTHGTKEAIRWLQQAIEIDYATVEWHYLYGKCLGRIRRVEDCLSLPKPEEEQELQMAVDATNGQQPYYMVHLAQCQRETALRLFSDNKVANVNAVTLRVNLLYDQVVMYYRAALAMVPSSVAINTRVGYGFMKLPTPYGDKSLAYSCLKFAITKSPRNPMVLHMWGLFNERMLDDFSCALQYYQMSAEYGVFGAWMDLIRLTFAKHRKAYDASVDLLALMPIFPEEPQKMELLCQLGSYHLFKKNNFSKALEYYKAALMLCPDSPYLMFHRCIFFEHKIIINLHHVIFDECRLAAANPKTDRALKQMCTVVIIRVVKYCQDCANVKPKPRRKEILQEVYDLARPWMAARRKRHEGRRLLSAKSSETDLAQGLEEQANWKRPNMWRNLAPKSSEREKREKAENWTGVAQESEGQARRPQQRGRSMLRKHVEKTLKPSILKGWLSEEQVKEMISQRNACKNAWRDSTTSASDSRGQSCSRSTKIIKERCFKSWRDSSASNANTRSPSNSRYSEEKRDINYRNASSSRESPGRRSDENRNWRSPRGSELGRSPSQEYGQYQFQQQSIHRYSPPLFDGNRYLGYPSSSPGRTTPESNWRSACQNYSIPKVAPQAIIDNPVTEEIRRFPRVPPGFLPIETMMSQVSLRPASGSLTDSQKPAPNKDNELSLCWTKNRKSDG